MTQTLPTPEVLRCYQHEGFEPRLRVMCLRWPDDEADQTWHLPDGLRVQGPPPRVLGVRIERQANQAYSVQLIWDRTALAWDSLSGAQLLTSSLRPLLAALGTDLYYLLDRPASVLEAPAAA